MFDVDVVSTGSHGNLNVIDGCIAIDCGVPAKVARGSVLDCDVVLVSHRHSDHVSVPSLRLLKRERPSLLGRVYANSDTFTMLEGKAPDLRGLLRVEGDNVLGPRCYRRFNAGGREYELETFPLVHDVDNQGFVLTNDLGETLLHATDTSSMSGAPDRVFDYILLEGNWDETKFYEYLGSGSEEMMYRAVRNLRHLSVQAFLSFVRSHSHDDTVVYQLHQSVELGIRAGELCLDELRLRVINHP